VVILERVGVLLRSANAPKSTSEYFTEYTMPFARPFRGYIFMNRLWVHSAQTGVGVAQGKGKKRRRVIHRDVVLTH
jgi:hypothetical protein